VPHFLFEASESIRLQKYSTNGRSLSWKENPL
jgi:hypothetical protein